MSGSTEALCCICQQSLDKPGLGRQVLPCGHTMHEQCVMRMRQYGASGRCPLCRQECDDLAPAQKVFDHALTHYMRKSWEECARLMSEVLVIDPQNSDAKLILGKMHHEGTGFRKDAVTAEAFYEEIRHAGPWVATQLGDLYEHEHKQIEKARSFYEEACRGGDPLAMFRLAKLTEGQGFSGKNRDARMEKVAGLYRDSLAGGYEKAATGLGMIRYLQGQTSEALEVLELGRKLGAVDASCGLGLIYQHQGMVSEARELFEEGHRLGDVTAAGLLGINYEKQGRLLKAGEFYKDGHLAGDPHATELLCQWYEKQGHTKEAKKIYEQGGQIGYPDFDRLLPSRDSCPCVRVLVHSLLSPEGQQLNGRLGTTMSYMETSDRFGVLIDDIGLKSIKAQNLVAASATEAERVEREFLNPSHVPELASDIDPDEISAQCAIQSSLDDATVSMPGGQDINAQVSQALLESRRSDIGPHVVLLTFSRSPRAYREVLMQAPELDGCRQGLNDRGFDVELATGAKLLVQPEHYPAVLEAVRLAGLTLMKQHVIVDPAFADVVVALVMGLPGRQKVLQKSASVVPLGFASVAAQMNEDVLVTKSFIHIHVPSSLASDAASGPMTVSTTDADPRNGKNHRCRKGKNH